MLRVLFVGNLHSEAVGTRSSAEELSAALEWCGVSCLTTSAKRNALTKAADMLATVVRRRAAYDVAVVDVYSGRAFRWAEVVCRALARMHKPHVLNLVGGNLPPFAARHPERVRRLLAPASAVTAPSASMAAAMRLYRDGIELLPSHGIELEDYPFRERSPCRPKLVWVRAFHDVYAPLVAIQTLRRLAERYPDCELVMVGPDKHDGTLEQVRTYATAHGLAERLRIVGPVPKAQVPMQLERGDVFLNTTRVESLGVSVIEAMACGLCVVSTDVGSLPDLVRDGSSGLLVPADDPAAMADAVSRVLEDDALASAVSTGARATAETFAWPRAVQRWTELLDGVAPGSGSV